MKKIFIVLISLLLLVITGCTDEQLNDNNNDNADIRREYNVFQGQSENWGGCIVSDFTETFTTVDGKLKYDRQTNRGSRGYLRYKGSEIKSLRNISYEVIDGAGMQGGTRGRMWDSEIKLGAEMYRSDDIINVTIEWNGKKENFEMKAISSRIKD